MHPLPGVRAATLMGRDRSKFGGMSEMSTSTGGFLGWTQPYLVFTPPEIGALIFTYKTVINNKAKDKVRHVFQLSPKK